MGVSRVDQNAPDQCALVRSAGSRNAPLKWLLPFTTIPTRRALHSGNECENCEHGKESPKMV